MEDEQKPQEPPPFRWNWQAKFMVAFFALLLAVPLAGVLWMLQGYAAKPAAAPPKPAAQVDTTGLEKGLEKMTDEHFSTTVATKIQDGMEIEVAPDDMAARSRRIAEIARAAGGEALDMSEKGDKTRRLMVQAPASRMELLKRAIRGEPVDFSAIPAGAETALLEVELKAP